MGLSQNGGPPKWRRFSSWCSIKPTPTRVPLKQRRSRVFFYGTLGVHCIQAGAWVPDLLVQLEAGVVDA